MRHARSAFVIAVAGLALGAATAPGFAAAATSPTTPTSPSTPASNALARAKSSATKLIEGELLYSGVESYVTTADKRVPLADRTALVSGLQADDAILKAQRADVQAATTLAGVRAASTVVQALQTYAFVLPRVNVVRASDDLSAYALTLSGKEAGYQAAIDSASKAGVNVTHAVAALAGLKKQVALATTLTAASHQAILLTLGTSGAQKSLAQDATRNLDAILHLAAGIRDASVITHLAKAQV